MLKRFNRGFAVMVVCFLVAAAVFPAGVSAMEITRTKTEWTIGIYLCGTDLESGQGSATFNLLQMIEAKISDDVNVVILTGGTETWDPEESGAGVEGYKKPNPEFTQLWKLTDDGMELVEGFNKENELFDMSDSETLAMFLNTLVTDYPSDRLMLSLWDHGGGPLLGVCVDEMYGNGIMSLQGIDDALSTVLNDSKIERDKIDLIGFDACLMSNMETAAVLAPYADYLVASADIEPGTGWNYVKWLNAVDSELKRDGDVTPVEMGRAIVDTFASTDPEQPDATWEDSYFYTLALVDLNKIDELLAAFNEITDRFTQQLLTDPELFAKVWRAAEEVDNMYDKSLGLLDLYDFAMTMKSLGLRVDRLLNALGVPPGNTPEFFVGETIGDGAVIYRGTGISHNNSVGLTFFYPTSRTRNGTSSEQEMENKISLYRDLNVSESYTNFLHAALEYVREIQVFDGEMEVDLTETPGENLNYQMRIDEEDLISIKSVEYVTTQQVVEQGKEKTYFLGNDQTEEDWEEGTFTDNFAGDWFSVDGNIATMANALQSETIGGLTIPVVVNDEEQLDYMTVIYSLAEDSDSEFEASAVSLMTINENGVPMRSIKPSRDMKIQTVLMEYDPEEGRVIQGSYKKNPPIVFGQEEEGYLTIDLGAKELTSGQKTMYTCYFKVTDIQGNISMSDPLYYIIVNHLEEMTPDPIPAQTYTGEPIEPEVSLAFAGTYDLLTEGTDYKVEYFNNVDVGKARVLISSIHDELDGSLTLYFDIVEGESQGEPEVYFTDVSSDHRFFKDIKYAVDNGWFNGVSETTFAPEASMTRGMLVTVLGRIDGADVSGYVDSGFSDVEATEYYAKYVGWAKDKGIVNGIGDNLFGPGQPLSRRDLVSIMKSYAQAESLELPDELFDDVFDNESDTDDYAKRAEVAAILHGLELAQGN